MIPTVQLNLLGPLELTADGSPLTGLRSQKAIALLAYLACNPGPQRREFLADLLWDASSTAQSLSNLRTVLSRLRRYVPNHLLVTPQTLAIAPDSPFQVDVARLEGQIEATKGRLSSTSALLLEETLRAYRGDFLAGFYLTDAAGFEQWAVVERERLRWVVLQGYRRLADFFLHERDYAAGTRVARIWLGLDSLDEEAHGQLMRLLVLNGQRAAALAHYDICRRILLSELAIEPGEQLKILYRQISQEQVSAPLPSIEEDSTATRTHHNLPQRLTSFVGRDEELATVRTLFSESNTRLVTLVGEGGVGKSSLAVAVGEAQLDLWTDGVYYVSLGDLVPDPVTTLSQRMATALAEAVGLTFSTTRGTEDPLVQLFRFVRDRSLLLILDNFEHLRAGAPFVADLMQSTPNCRLLVTSREPLLLSGESVVRLDGLPVPPESAPLPLPDTAYASVALFAERARQKQHTFALSSTSRQALARLCRLVAGNALALELAAAWVEHFSLNEMVTLVESDMLDFLRNPQPHVPQRHRTLRRVMETSWQLLSTHVQQVLAQLSIFRGSFHREAALAVSDGSLHLLVDLVNCSLLQQREPGRYELHEIVRQFAAERLGESADGGKQIAQRHAYYYLALVGSVERKPDRIPQVSEELANVRQAWNWAVAARSLDGLATGSIGLWNFYLRKGLFQEAEEAFGRGVVAALASPAGTKGRKSALAALQVAQAVFLNIRNHYDKAIEVAEQAVVYALQEENEVIIARGYLQWGTALYRQGHYTAAIKQLDMALMAAQDAGLEGDEADVLRHLGVTWLEQGDFAAAHARCQDALAIYRRTGNRLGEGNTLNDLGWINQRQQSFEEAQAYLEAARSTHQAINNHHGVTIALINLGSVQQMLGDFSAAYDTYRQLFHDLDGMSDRYHHSLINQSLGVLLSRLGAYSVARRHLMTSMEIDRSIGDQGGLAWSYNALGLLHNHLGDYKTGLAYHNQALEIGSQQGAATLRGIALLGIGQDLQELGHWKGAHAAYEKAIGVQAELKQSVRVLESRSGLARSLLGLKEPDLALAQVEVIVDYLTTQNLVGAAQPALVYWNCYTVLRALEDARAPTLLADAFDLVQAQATRIREKRVRHSYLYAVPAHRAILHEVGSLRLSPRFVGLEESKGDQKVRREM